MTKIRRSYKKKLVKTLVDAIRVLEECVDDIEGGCDIDYLQIIGGRLDRITPVFDKLIPINKEQ